MIEPNRYTAPGEIAARTRVEALFARMDELGPDMLLLAVPGFDLEARVIALDELEDLADRRGRGALLDDARQRVRDGLAARMATRNPGYPVGQAMVASGTVEDQVARMMAIEDVVSVAVAEDLLDHETIAFLSAPGRRMLGLAPLDPPEIPDQIEDAPAPGAMTADDQDDADEPDVDEEDADEDEIEAASAKRQQRVALFFLIGLIVLLIAWSNGISLPMIALILLATALIAWLFA